MKTKLIFLLLILSLIPLINLLTSGLPITHDGKDHVARIANFYQNLQEGNLVPRWGENLNWGYGHPVLMFLYPLPSYITSLFHLLGFSLVDSTKLFFAATFIFSIITMYLWLKTFLSEKAAFVGSVLYGFAPYHFVDLYVRGAIGEMAAFVFPPLVLYFLQRLSQKNNYWNFMGGSLSLAGFILAHNAVSLMFLPVIILYGCFLILFSKNKKRLLFQYSLIFIIGFSLSAFFWLPAFAEGRYTLRDIVTKGSVQNNFVAFPRFLYGPWDYGISGMFTVQVGLLQWLGILFSVPALIHFHKKKKKEWIIIFSSLILFFGSLFLMTPLSKPVWDNITLLQKFQFPWRFLSLSMFFAAILGALAFSFIPKKFEKISFILFIVLTLFLTKDMWHAKDYMQKPESFYSGIYNGTTDTGESAPIWSVRFMEERPKSHVEVIGGIASVQEGQRTTTRHEYKVIASNNAQLRENTLYFPGWKILVDNVSVPIEFQDPHNRGVMTFRVDQGRHNIVMLFEETRLRSIANLISLASLFSLVVLGILKKKIWRN